jgi:hypothetical protein
VKRVIIPELPEKVILRFWSNIEVNGKDDCWPWLSYLTSQGYARFRYLQKHYLASRVMFYLIYGVDPGELSACHECNNPVCVNPNHLYLGTQSENLKQAYQDGRKYRRNFAKLTEVEVLHIRDRLDEREVASKLATEFGVDRGTIYSIKSRQSWSDI